MHSFFLLRHIPFYMLLKYLLRTLYVRCSKKQFCLLQEAVRRTVIQMDAGDQVMMSVFSVLGTDCKDAVSTIVILPMATMLT